MRARLSRIPVVTAVISPASQHRTPDRGSETMRHSCRQPGHRAPPVGSAEASRQTMACSRPWRTGQGTDAPVPQCSLGQLVPDQARVQVPALRPPVGALDPRRDNVPIAGPDDPSLPPIQARARRPLRQAGVADQRGHRRERARAVPPGMAGQADEHELVRAGRLDAAIGRDRASFGAQIASTLTGHRSSDVLPRSRRPSLLSQFCLIHLRPAPFTSDRPCHVRAGHGRWRPLVNTGQHCWKACWGQPLASSNLASSATLICYDAFRLCSRGALRPKCVSHFLSQLTPGTYVLFRTNRRDGTLRRVTLYLVRDVVDVPNRNGARR